MIYIYNYVQKITKQKLFEKEWGKNILKIRVTRQLPLPTFVQKCALSSLNIALLFKCAK